MWYLIAVELKLILVNSEVNPGLCAEAKESLCIWFPTINIAATQMRKAAEAEWNNRQHRGGEQLKTSRCFSSQSFSFNNISSVSLFHESRDKRGRWGKKKKAHACCSSSGCCCCHRSLHCTNTSEFSWRLFSLFFFSPSILSFRLLYLHFILFSLQRLARNRCHFKCLSSASLPESEGWLFFNETRRTCTRKNEYYL